ncbi:MAG: hypothetical protein EA401_03370 [Planctomycetota bacterium]|nr:MAG: hypothetical protein EA401_03370 [Planctomycetota bacterium]
MRWVFIFAALLVCSTLAIAPGMSLEIGLGHISQSIDEDTRPLDGDTLRMIGPRGGHATGVIIAAGRGPAAVQARLGRGGLVHSEDDSQNITRQVQVLYGSLTTDFARNPSTDAQSSFHDALIPRSEGTTAVQSLYVHIPIPRDSTPGLYRGTIDVRGRGGSAEIPIELYVSAMQLPPPQERRTWVDMLQSPDSVAYRYGVTLYSRQHLERLRPSMEMMANLGQQAMHVTAIAQTNFGNDEAMLAIGPRGIDFSGLEAYMNLFNETIGAPRFIIVYVYDGGSNDGVPQWTPPGGRRNGSTPALAASYGAEHRPIWQAAMEGLKQRAEQAGWEDTEILLGWIGDARPFGDYLECFTEVAPFARWVQFTHARGDPDERGDSDSISMLGMEVAYRIVPYSQHSISRGGGSGRGGWDNSFLQVSSMRGTNNQDTDLKFWLSQIPHAVQDGGSAHATSANFRGIGRIGMDFWQVQRPDGSSGRLLKRFSRWGNLQRDTAPALTAVGPEGALPTSRYLALWQGIQETEARILTEIGESGAASPENLSRQELSRIREQWWALRKVDELPPDLDAEHQALKQLYDAAAAVQAAQ